MIYKGDALTYILQTPEILTKIMEKQDAVFLDCIRLLDGMDVSELYLVGSGSSYHSAAAASGFLQKLLGIRVFPVYPAPFMEHVQFMDKNAVLLGISQQGTSRGVIEAMDSARALGRRVISVTGEYDTEIISHGDENIYVECGYEDAGATTKGYTASVLTLLLFGLQLARASNKISRQQWLKYQSCLKKTISNMDLVLAQGKEWCGRTAEQLKDSRELVILSTGNQTASLAEGILKFSETCRFLVRGFEAEEFMHGMYNAVNPEVDFLYLFPSREEDGRRLKQLYQYYQKQGNRQFTINMEGDIFRLVFLNEEEFFVLESILPLQMLFVLASRARGIDLNIPKDPEFHKRMGSKLEKKNEITKKILFKVLA